MVRLNPLYVFGTQGEAERVFRRLRGCAGGVLATVFPRRGQLQDVVNDGRARSCCRGTPSMPDAGGRRAPRVRTRLESQAQFLHQCKEEAAAVIVVFLSVCGCHLSEVRREIGQACVAHPRVEVPCEEDSAWLL